MAECLAFGERTAVFLMGLVRNLPRDTGYLISKGGITPNDTLSSDLDLRMAGFVGQVGAA